MKRIIALFVLLVFLIALISCANTEEGYVPEVGNTVLEETAAPLFSPESSVTLTPEDEYEILLAYAKKYNDSEPDINEYNIRCYGILESEEYGKIYAVIIERPGFEAIGFDEYFDSPYDYPITREYSPDVYDVWTDMRAPLLLYKNGEFFPWRSGIASNDFIKEVIAEYQKCNESFYAAMGIYSGIETTSP